MIFDSGCQPIDFHLVAILDLFNFHPFSGVSSAGEIFFRPAFGTLVQHQTRSHIHLP